MGDNIFIREESFYQRDINPIDQYIKQSAFYISKIKNIPIDEAINNVKQCIEDKRQSCDSESGIRDPIVKYYERYNFEDKEIVNTPLSRYIKSISDENLIMAPSMTCYVHPELKSSLLSEFTDYNVKLRSIAKKKAEQYKVTGDIDKYRYYNNEQENKKLYNNALSGAFSSYGSIVRNPTAHSSLTSTTRTMTSIGNASNERLISGNRHYRDPEITLNNIVILAQTAQKDEIRQTLDKYRLKIPSVEETMSCIQYSTNLYWNDFRQMNKIKRFVETLTDEERASVVYTGDLYHIRQLNPEIIRDFITRLSQKVKDRLFDDPASIINKYDQMLVNYVHQICLSEVKGIGKDYSNISKEQASVVAATCMNVQAVLEEYRGFIHTFFLTANMPCSVAYIKNCIRRTVVLSDTDSTMFSCDEWVIWYYGELRFTDEAFAISGAVMYIATQCIAHNLAIYSANLNVERSKLFKASMKPEYVFGVFSLTSAGKHYYTYVMVKEGSVYKDIEMEIKGVYLKNSAAPKPIMTDVKNMMESILKTIRDGQKISLTKWVNHVVRIEKEIKRSVLSGEITYLGRMNIKSQDAYKVSPEQSNFRYHLFWNEVFGPKYGMAPEPTYTAVKFPTILSSKKALAIWLSNITDIDLKNRLIRYFERTKRSDLNTVYISQDLIEAYGVPEEVQSIIDIEGLVLQHMGAHRMVLESIGLFLKQDMNLTQMGYDI